MRVFTRKSYACLLFVAKTPNPEQLAAGHLRWSRPETANFARGKQSLDLFPLLVSKTRRANLRNSEIQYFEQLCLRFQRVKLGVADEYRQTKKSHRSANVFRKEIHSRLKIQDTSGTAPEVGRKLPVSGR
jgi:hypothetical protein